MVDRREKIARLAQSKEDEVLLARVYERITLAAQRNVPASTCFLSKREQMIVQLRFGINTRDGEEKTQKEVADLLGISQSYISRLEKRIIKRLRREIVRLEV